MHIVSTRTHTLLGLAVSCAVPALASADPIKMPWRGDALPANSYMRTDGHVGYDCPNGSGGGCSNDIYGVRWDPAAGSFTRSKTTIQYGSTSATFLREDAVAWEMELYAPVSGEIVACWSGIPDDEPDGSDPTECPASNICQAGGNILLIHADDGHLVALSHLRQGSIPDHLCPNDSGVVFASEDKMECDLGAGWQDAVRESTLLDDPIPVEKGELIGKVGLSGSATIPHLHMGLYDLAYDGDGDMCQRGVPLGFMEGWSQAYTLNVAPTAAGWLRRIGMELAYTGAAYLLWGDPVGVVRDTDAVAAVESQDLALSPAGGVLAYRDTLDDLVLRGFDYTSGEAFTYGAVEVHADVGDIAVARVDDVNGHVVAAFANSAGKLQVVPYFMTAGHSLVEGIDRTESTTGVGQVEATRAPTHDGVVVAIKNSLGGMSVIDYTVDLTGTDELTIDRAGDDDHSTAITDLDIATVTQGRGLSEPSGAFKGVVTVERRTDGTVWLRTWQIDNAGAVDFDSQAQVKHIDTGAAFIASEVDLTVVGSTSNRQYAVVSMATSSGLRVQNWTVSTSGALTPIDQYDGGPVSHIDSAAGGQADAIVGVRITTGQMSLLSFQVENDGRLRRGGTIDGGTIEALAVDAWPGSDDVVVMPVAPASHNATLQHYLSNYSSTL